MKTTTLESLSGKIVCHDSEGTGRTLVLVHGNSASSKAFAKQFDSTLGAKHRVIAFDLPGHGESDNATDPAATYNMPGYARVLRDVVKQLGVEDAEGNYAKTLKSQPGQNAHLEFEEFRAALDKLPQDQREALILVGASGFSYEDAAAICGCAVGTIKSRVNRARTKLSALLYVDGAEDFGPDDTVRAVIGGSGNS
jgi:RNA polymerase sigma factor (sigma-70 family)